MACDCNFHSEVLGGFEECRICNCGADSFGDGNHGPKKPVLGFHQCEETLCGVVFLELDNDSLELILISIVD